MKVVVVYRKRASGVHHMAIFDNVKVDDIISGTKRKPMIPDSWTIDEIGVGESFVEKYSKKFKINSKSFNPDFSVSK